MGRKIIGRWLLPRIQSCYILTEEEILRSGDKEEEMEEKWGWGSKEGHQEVGDLKAMYENATVGVRDRECLPSLQKVPGFIRQHHMNSTCGLRSQHLEDRDRKNTSCLLYRSGSDRGS